MVVNTIQGGIFLEVVSSHVPPLQRGLKVVRTHRVQSSGCILFRLASYCLTILSIPARASLNYLVISDSLVHWR
jgi:hypothetical protein